MTNSFELELPIYPESAKFSIDSDIAKTNFACDLSVCKGACCTLPGGLGAPILFEEIEIIEKVFPIVKKYLPQAALDAIAVKGLYRRNIDGTYTIETVGHNECVFVRWEGDIGYCSIQSAFYNGETGDYPKPISCHLFPIRIYPEPEEGTYYMCYVEESECEGGRKRGASEGTNLLDYLKAPLERALGEGRYEDLKKKLIKK